MKILFASTNIAKIEQFRFVVRFYHFPIEIVPLYQAYPSIIPYSEEYSTQEEIIEQGSKEIYQQIQKPLIVEDTILEVDALGKKPGLHASEYLKEKGRKGLLEELSNKTNRTARIISLIGYFDNRILAMMKYSVAGTIANKERYTLGEPAWVGPTTFPQGGGYNAVFIPDGLQKTLAELTAEEGLVHGYREANYKAIIEYILSSTHH